MLVSHWATVFYKHPRYEVGSHSSIQHLCYFTSVLGMLLDLTEVFDTVGHDLLTHKLTDGVVLKWLSSLLQGWGQRTALGERVSTGYLLMCRFKCALPHPAAVEIWAGMLPVCWWYPAVSAGGWLSGHCPTKLGQGARGCGGMVKKSTEIASS